MSTTLAITCCAPLSSPVLSDDEATATAELFRALADPARVRIVNVLATSDEAVCVCNLIEPLGLSQPTVSPPHAEARSTPGSSTREQRGKWAFFTLKRDAVEKLAGRRRPERSVLLMDTVREQVRRRYAEAARRRGAGRLRLRGGRRLLRQRRLRGRARRSSASRCTAPRSARSSPTPPRSRRSAAATRPRSPSCARARPCSTSARAAAST